jgi:hypothetical protein
MLLHHLLPLLGFVALIPAIACFCWGRSNQKKARRIVATRTTPIKDLRAGFVEVKGRARAQRQPLESPLSRRPCVYYHLLIEQLVGPGKHHEWETMVEDEQDAGCLITDKSGSSVAVNLRAAELLLEPDVHARSGLLNDAPPEFEALLNSRYHTSSQGWVFNKSVRYTETVLDEGAEIYVLGTATRRDREIVIDKGKDLFIVSDQTEEQVASTYHGNKLAGFLFGGLFLAGSVVCGVLSHWRLHR